MKRMVAILLFILLAAPVYLFAGETDGLTEWERDFQEKSLQLERDRFSFERMKWEWDRSEEKRKEYEGQFPSCFDLKRHVPTYEFTGYVSDTERRELQKIFTILIEQGIPRVRMNISSFGGSAFDGMGIADAIESARRKGLIIEGYAYGKIASAAVPIFAACSLRYTGPSTLFMVHEATMFKFLTVESKSDLESQNEMFKKLQDRYVDMLVRNSKRGADHWHKAIKKETWFTAETAQEWGIVDNIE